MFLEAPKNFDEFITLIKSNDAVCFYLSIDECNVCKVLKPKLIDLIAQEYPNIKFCYIDLNKSKEISGQLSVFSVPTILFFFDGKEVIRESRNINLEELRVKICRYNNLKFG